MRYLVIALLLTGLFIVPLPSAACTAETFRNDFYKLVATNLNGQVTDQYYTDFEFDGCGPFPSIYYIKGNDDEFWYSIPPFQKVRVTDFGLFEITNITSPSVRNLAIERFPEWEVPEPKSSPGSPYSSWAVDSHYVGKYIIYHDLTQAGLQMYITEVEGEHSRHLNISYYDVLGVNNSEVFYDYYDLTQPQSYHILSLEPYILSEINNDIAMRLFISYDNVTIGPDYKYNSHNNLLKVDITPTEEIVSNESRFNLTRNLEGDYWMSYDVISDVLVHTTRFNDEGVETYQVHYNGTTLEEMRTIRPAPSSLGTQNGEYYYTNSTSSRYESLNLATGEVQSYGVSTTSGKFPQFIVNNHVVTREVYFDTEHPGYSGGPSLQDLQLPIIILAIIAVITIFVYAKTRKPR